ncbi:hypothetical protein OCF84_21425 (plasmid) [Shewanella xiamenensis]|uniref:Uncharacterized protein n=1 Tax=Shewanella xiamenensis TaxID=332186 RepID=A0ABT6UDL5_9GAMM|nr:hypothetical protein [Shewanella xiamenensis]MDI5832562.1 hypothetical protein [Shewanella xiamenensis]WHF57820.1 hypothetical protein OCF84_21425 [Shewanella xiamenensis]
MNSKPLCHFYLHLDGNPFFNETWNKKRLPDLMKDLSWVEQEEPPVSKDFDHDDFPTYWNWPQNWRTEYEAAKHEASLLLKQHVSNFEVFNLDGCTVYIDDCSGEVFASSAHHCHGDLCSAEPHDSFDSATTAAYAFVNDFKDWHSKWSGAYEAANILSKATRNVDDTVVGTTEECDGCAAYSKIVKVDAHGNALCATCANK